MRVATDIGGTFTDLVCVDDNGKVRVAKADTTPPNFEQGVMDVIVKAELDGEQIGTFIHGTTVIINALTERNGVKTGLITTKGFRDVLEIARGNRPDLFNVRYQKPTPFVPRALRLEVEERLNQKGEVITTLSTVDVENAVEKLRKEGVEAIAVCYLHAYANPQHEKQTVELIKQMWPEVAVTASYEVTKEWREYERTNTAVLNSYVKPVAERYVNKLNEELLKINATGQKYIMQSNAGTTTFEQSKQSPIHMVESGPVAGVFGAAILGKMIGYENVIAFDIGGTTAKCSLIDGGEVTVTTDYRIEWDDRHAGYPIKVPVVDIVEVGNGGGSIAWIDQAGALKVGPKSAGALPGPVAYGRGGTEPTTTDANLVTGRLSPKNFSMSVQLDSVRSSIEDKIAQKFGVSVEEAALGIIRIANSNMLNALKLISVRRGYDPRDFAMVAFGGGGAMHAAFLAKELGVTKVVVPVGASVFSAWGMLMTDLRHDYLQTFIRRTSDLDLSELNGAWKVLEQQAIEQYQAEDIAQGQIVFNRYADMRYLGQEHTVKVPIPSGVLTDELLAKANAAFHAIHEQNYTFKLENNPTEIVNLHLVAFGKVTQPEIAELEPVTHTVDQAVLETRPVYFEEDGWLDTTVFDRERLGAGFSIEGPAIVEEPSTSTLVYPGQKLTVDKYGNLIIDTGVQ
ncbi:hydantoinase/oxoprolinase family protein [Alicyclobacillus fastidiosus]|uniref:Hydantoinase/oxoprolinase family protein n=1 Tax=Alicyclobacillus fastidiosus TaxID=392011 RepID=A0ABY6ZB19_9BACL|nr:hydantoinase/oxoprolinase family protein [Alicyclobacillus fastidiosus]WAH39727.1 hydantoinase/oxoprolinase family protein [Alicyclobacillus fastidiosus]GMA60954.1 5-oxoprolinase [Alicyclobacillus fastidiosus]